MSGSSRWPVTWDDAREALLDSALAATPAQRLEWLEAALKLAYEAGALPANTAGTDAVLQIRGTGKKAGRRPDGGRLLSL